MNRHVFRTLGVCIAAAPALLSAPALGANDSPGSTPMFMSCDKLRGMDVRNTRNEDLGSIHEVIIDRGSGRAPYVVLKSGSILGLGGKNVVVPWNAFTWDQIDKKATLNTTSEHLKTLPEFNADRWRATGRSTDMLPHTLAREYYKDVPSSSAAWPSDSADERRITGKVVSISREPMYAHGEDTIVTVATNDGRTETVVLGPSWYMSGSSVALYRDAPVDFRVARVNRNGRPVFLARGMTIDARDTSLYSDKGVAVWAYDNPANKDSTMVSPFMLSGEIDGKSVEARGEKCGSVNDLIMETGSGRVAFFSIDPDKNVLGIGDTKRLVPWTVATTITSDRVFLDASKAMITSSPETPSDLRNLGDDRFYGSIYRSYDVKVPTFERTPSTR